MTEFKRGGFQPDGTYIQRISRQTENSDGVKGWFPPEPGQRIVTQKGPFKVEKVIEVIIREDGSRFFRAEGSLINL